MESREKISHDSNILIISHYLQRSTFQGEAAPHNIRNFLLDKVKTIYYLEIPFPNADYHRATLIIYKNGKIDKKVRSFTLSGPDWFQYIQHPLIINVFTLCLFTKIDICFALDDLSVVSVLPMRYFGLIKRLIYYTIDYTPQRFPNKVLNYLYHLADRLALRCSDKNWVVSRPIVKAKKLKSAEIVPIGYRTKRIKIPAKNKVDPFHLIFIGTFYEKQGLQLVIDTLPDLLNRFPKIHLTAIGSGEYKDKIKSKVKSMKLSKAVEFMPFIRNHQRIVNILTRAGVGLAPYAPIPENFSYYADPSKIKLYIICGLPVITTKVAVTHKQISKYKAGVVIKYHKRHLYNALVRILKNKISFGRYRRSAIGLSEKFDIDSILTKFIQTP